MDTPTLLAKQASLESQETIFSQQSQGQKGMTRDLRMLQDQLTACAYVLRERGAIVIVPPPINVGVGTVNFYNVDNQCLPPGSMN